MIIYFCLFYNEIGFWIYLNNFQEKSDTKNNILIKDEYDSESSVSAGSFSKKSVSFKYFDFNILQFFMIFRL